MIKDIGKVIFSAYFKNEKQLELIEKSPFRWEVPIGTVPGMKVPGEIFASREMINRIIQDKTPFQTANVATLPGIIGSSKAMPDIHWGYGFPIGGVAAFDLEKGVISPGGVGYDINCGVTLIRSNILSKDVKPEIKKLIDALFNKIPCGVGSESKSKIALKDFEELLIKGAKWVVQKGMGSADDVKFMEENGALPGADPSYVTDRAKKRGLKQLGTLGSGNHFIEIQEVAEIFDKGTAKAFGLFKGQTVIMIHSGSRGLGHQVCDDSLKIMQGAARKYNIPLIDRQLACAPFRSTESQEYLKAMKCAANFAWGNRLSMVNLVREVFSKYFSEFGSKIGLSMVYDVCHNIAKVEKFSINGIEKEVCIHRKGATRALGPGDRQVPEEYRKFGQPVLIPGDMGRSSYVLAGSNKARDASFSSSCHGAGRVLSRKAAHRRAKGKNINQLLSDWGITVRAKGKSTLIEEVPEAYKDISEVVNAVEGAGLSKPVVRLKPIGTIKG